MWKKSQNSLHSWVTLSLMVSLANCTHSLCKTFPPWNGSGSPPIYSHFHWYRMNCTKHNGVDFMWWLVQEPLFKPTQMAGELVSTGLDCKTNHNQSLMFQLHCVPFWIFFVAARLVAALPMAHALFLCLVVYRGSFFCFCWCRPLEIRADPEEIACQAVE